MYTFSESLTIQLPKLGSDYSSHQESVSDSGLVVEIAAIHEGLTANYNMYSAKELQDSLETWVNPYPRPVITNHDTDNDTLGRIMAAKIAKEDGLVTIMLQAAIEDSLAVEKFRDKRYLTGSVGGKADKAICSICETDWAKPTSAFEAPCEHRRGTLYKGQLAYLAMRGINWKEYSMVNVPADSNSSVRGMSAEAPAGEDWVKASVFSVDMNKESIISFGESGSVDILANKKRKDAISIYHDTRGAFLSAFVSSIESDKETEVPEPIENDDDILAATEELSDELADAAPAPEAEPESTEDDTDAVDAPEEDAPADENSDDATEEAEPELESAEDSAPEDTEESTDDADAPEATEEDPEGDEPDVSETDDTPAEEPASNDVDEPAEADAELANAQERITALEAENTRLFEENGKLRGALKKGLAERVVDTKISLGYESADDRASLIESHVSRSASSLKDSMLDLAKAPRAQAEEVVEPTEELFNGKSLGTSVKGDTKVTTENVDDSQANKLDPSDLLENIFVDGLLGKRRL